MNIKTIFFTIFFVYITNLVYSQKINYYELGDTLVITNTSKVKSFTLVSEKEIFMSDTIEYNRDTLYINVSKIPQGMYLMNLYDNNYVFFDYITILKNSEIKKDTQTTKMPKNYVSCSDIVEIEDEFTNETTYYARINSELVFIKVKNRYTSTYYLAIDIKSYGIYNGNGVYLILQNGKRISKIGEKVKTDYRNGDFFATAFISLNTEDINLLKNNSIEKYKIYIHDGDCRDTLDSSKLLLNCLLNKK
jgi:hypothetical protein